jgi:hypothetical protein
MFNKRHDAGMEPGGGFYEEDEPVIEIVVAFEQGTKGRTASPARGRTDFLYLGGVGLANFAHPTHNETYGRLVHH